MARDGYWKHTFDSHGTAARRGRTAPSASDTDDGRRLCGSAAWCVDYSITRDSEGKMTRTAAATYQGACGACQTAVADRLPKLPRQYLHLAAEIGVPSQDCAGIHMPFGPSIPIRCDIDAIMRGMVVVLTSWHQRLVEVPRLNLSVPDPNWTTGQRIVQAVKVLKGNLAPLVALPPAMMKRTVHDTLEDVELDGGKACGEILKTHEQAQHALGEVNPRPEELLAVRCYQCQAKALVRADPPLKDRDPEWYSRCRRCGHLMTHQEYRQHCKRELAIAQGRVETPRLAG